MKQLPEEDHCGTRKFTSHSHKRAEQQPEEDHCAVSEAGPEHDSLRELVCDSGFVLASSTRSSVTGGGAFGGGGVGCVVVVV